MGNTHDGNLFVARQAFSNCTLIFTCSPQNWWNVCVSCGFSFLGLVLPGARGESKSLLLCMRTYGTTTRTSFEELEAAIRGAMSVPPLAFERMKRECHFRNHIDTTDIVDSTGQMVRVHKG
ncbi:unnamed protein product [Ectocarpus sp. 12 AP-2014]